VLRSLRRVKGIVHSAAIPILRLSRLSTGQNL
jgi:hypothetical protein